jgi:CRISPR/Cas system-associated exonuclease Cas4 (RecB family)
VPAIRIIRSEKTLLEFENEILYQVLKIQDEFYPMRVTHPGCNFCAYRDHCTSAAETAWEDEDVSAEVFD